jgi:hypothetical protein
MGAWRACGWAVLVAALLHATAAAAAANVEPIARLYLEGGYDSNPLYNGQSADQVVRVSPEVGLHLLSRTLDLKTSYGGEYVRYEKLAPGGVWNQRGALSLDSHPARRTELAGELRVWQTFDPQVLAALGVFRTSGQQALLVGGRARLEWRSDRLDTAAFTFLERTVVFEDHTGGAMHQPGIEALRRIDERLSLGAAYAYGVFESFLPGPDERATSHALRVRARFMAERHLALEAFAGPALWLPPGRSAIVPEGFFQVLYGGRGLDLRASVSHTLGLGATAEPGLVDALEGGIGWRFRRTWFARGAGGFWRSGTAPDGAFAVTGYAMDGEIGRVLGGGLRLSVTGAHYGRVDSAAPMYRRTTLGLRLGWELRTR